MSWKPPASDGGAPIEGYVVEFRRKGDVKWMPSKKDIPDCECRAPGLKPGTEYEFRIAAKNKAGIGPFSPPSDAGKYGECVRVGKIWRSERVREIQGYRWEYNNRVC